MKNFIIVALTFIFRGGIFANPMGKANGNKIACEPKSGRPVTLADYKMFISSIGSLTILDTPATTGILIPNATYINARALKDFQARFGDTTRAFWYPDGNGFSSYFTKDGYNDRVYYNKNGRWKYSLIYFDQDKFPENLRRIIKSNYSAFDIDIVVEVQTNYGTAYLVYLGNKSRIRVLKMNTEGEMETITDLARG